jgi:hypothetical protein
MLMSIVSSNRIKTITKVKQAGNYALGQIQTMLRNAKSIKTCDSTAGTITIINQDGGETQILNDSNSRIASGSGIYLTPENTTASLFSLSCNPSDLDPTIVKVSFDLRDAITPTQKIPPSLRNPVNLRNK